MINLRDLHIGHRVMSLLMAAVLCVQYLPVAVTAEAASISDFGDGSDGALYIAAGQTVTLSVPVPHQSVVERNYTSVYIAEGGVLQCSDYNAGLVIRSTGDVTINGTIDQRGKAPKTNPNNTYPYPPELTCGSGGSGGAIAPQTGGRGMPGRPYGGGYGGGGAGYTNDSRYGNGGNADGITVDISNIFIGGAAGTDDGRKSTPAGSGTYGGGGGGRGDHDRDSGSNGNGGAGGSGPGGKGGDGDYGGSYVTTGHGGGAGNTGGGVVLIYAKGKITISGTIDCSGLNGGNSGVSAPYYGGVNGSGGGGGGGGAFYAEAGGAVPTVSGTINVSGGAGGERGLSYGVMGNAGGYGNSTVKRATDTTSPKISGVIVSTGWGLTNSATITASDDVSGVVSYAITTSSAVPGNGSWQSSNSFTLSSNGTYYAWAKDVIGNTTTGYPFTISKVDNTVPVVTNVVVSPTGWTSNSTKTITVTATDSQSGIAVYGITTSNTAPTAWQAGNTFSKAVGTYYVWAKDNTGRVSTSRQVTVAEIDTAVPVVTNAAVTPSGWTSGNKTITVTATDSQSGIAGYGITTTNTVPTTWQTGNTFSKVAGTYYVWAKDNTGRVSTSRQVTVAEIDTAVPVVTNAAVTPSGWTSGNKTITVTATDSQSGIAGYGITTSNTAPTTWQTGNTFGKAAGAYYVWAKDNTGRVSASRQVTVAEIDTAIPVVTNAAVTPSGWTSGNKTITVTATDSQSGIVGYGITTSNTAPTTWQTGNTFNKATGTYYVWAKDKVGNVSASKQVTVDGIDTVKPVVTATTVTPTGWVGSSTKTIAVTATDSGSGIAEYGITATNTAPTAWQADNTFSKAAGTYYIWAKDKVGNVSTSKSVTVDSIDTVKPVVTATTVTPTGWTGSSTKTITVTATDSGSGIAEYGITATNTAPTAWQAGNTFSKAAGTYYVWAKDKVGNVSTSKSVTVDGIDTVKPVVTATTVTPTGWTGSSTKTITVTATDGGSGIAEYGITATNTAPTAWQADNTFSKAAGTYYVWAKDKVGNVSTSKLVTVDSIDTVKPVVTVTTVTPTGWTGSSTKTIAVTATDSGSGIAEYGITTANTAPATWQAGNTFSKAAGTYYVWARDKVGNVSLSKQAVVDGIDTSIPVVSKVTTSQNWSQSNVATIIATDVGVGLQDYAVTTGTTLPAEGWESGSSFTLSANGTYYAWVRDKVGNVSLPHTFTVDKVDDIKPTVDSVTTSPGWGTDVTAKINATDSESGIQDYAVTTDTALPAEGWESGSSFTISANGRYYAWVRDKVGNVSLPYTFTVDKVDDIKPTVDSVTTSPGWGTDVIAEIAATDNESGIQDYTVTTDTTFPADGWENSNSFTLSANGTYYAWVRDKVGNVSLPYAFTVDKVDDIKPTVDSVTTSPGWGTDVTAKINATDSQSGIQDYAVTTDTALPAEGWESGSSFTISANGRYYAWVRDKVGNVSLPYAFTVDKVDDIKPTVDSVTTSPGWGTDVTAKINATDSESGIQDYAVTTDTALPAEGWESGSSFTISANGRYYAWVRDKVGNVSLPYTFTVDKVDDIKPTVDSVTVSPSWGTDVTAKINATDSESGIQDYAVTTDTALPAEGWESGSSFTISANGRYYAWVRDKVGKVDDIKPTVDSVTTSPGWGTDVIAEIAATDSESGIQDYAVTTDTALPTDGWESGSSFTLSANGTYYAWVRDRVGNVSLPYTFTVDKVDDIKPTVDSVTTSPGWGTDVTAKINATDSQSGIQDYAVTTDTALPTDGWENNNSFTLSANGTHYAWVRDKVGNVSLPYAFTVEKVDDIKPTVDSVTTSPGWGTDVTAKINATDSESGIQDYAVTTDTALPTDGWESGSSFTISANGTYYAWTRDKVGNVSLPFAFTVEKVDDIKPKVDSVTTSLGWGTSSVIGIGVSDLESGIQSYAVTVIGTEPTEGWQDNSSFTLLHNGKYYAWARDNAGNASLPFPFAIEKVDKLKPVIESITVKEKRVLKQGRRSMFAPGLSSVEEVPDKWVKTVELVMQANDSPATKGDGCSGVVGYAITTSEVAPIDGWQTDAGFTLDKNNTYYLWAVDAAGNISIPRSYDLNKIDDVPPEFDGGGAPGGSGGNSSVSLPERWVAVAGAVVQGSDNTGTQDFAVTETTAPPTHWQDTPLFELEANGSYYAWIKDKADNITGPDIFEVTMVDNLPPGVSSVVMNGSTAEITAEDTQGDERSGCSGIIGYAMTKMEADLSKTRKARARGSSRAGTDKVTVTDFDWQPINSIVLSEGGLYEVRTIDRAGNISEPLLFEYRPSSDGDDVWDKVVDDILNGRVPEDKVYSITMDGRVRIPRSLLEQLRGKAVMLRIEHRERYVWAIDCRTIGDIPAWRLYYDLTVEENKEINRYLYQLPYSIPVMISFDVAHNDKSDLPFSAELSVRLHYSFADRYVYYRFKDAELMGGELAEEKLPKYLRKKRE